MRRENGFTLVELMIGLGLLAILAAFAIPSYERLVRNNVADKFQDDLYADLALARSEALAQGRPVTICASADLLTFTGSNPSCAGSDDWSTGWMTFVDDNDNQTLDGGERLLSVYEEAPGGAVALDYNNGGVITFDRLGRTAGYNGTFEVCRDDVGYASALVLSPTGRARYSDTGSIC